MPRPECRRTVRAHVARSPRRFPVLSIVVASLGVSSYFSHPIRYTRRSPSLLEKARRRGGLPTCVGSTLGVVVYLQITTLGFVLALRCS